MREGSYRLRQLKENMIYHSLLSLFIINLFPSLFAADEVNISPMETSLSLGSYIHPALPQMNISYDELDPDTNQSEFLQSPLNFQKDGSTYCPHTEILTRILNELRRLLPQDSEKLKNVLSTYYTILENALNSRHNVESLKLSSDNRLNYVNSIAQKLLKMDDKNSKIKISMEYEIPKMHNVCEKICNDLLNFANPEKSPAINDLNYANDQSNMKNNFMTFLQNDRPENINSNSSSYIKLKKNVLTMNEPDNFDSPNSDTHPSNPVSLNLPIINPLQSLSQPLSNHSETPISDPVVKVTPELQSSTETDSLSGQRNSSPPLSSPTGNKNFIFSQNFAAAFQKPTENLSPQFLEPKGIYKYPFHNSIPVLQSYKGPLNSYPLQSSSQLFDVSYKPFQTLKPRSQIPNGAPNYYSLLNLAPPIPNQKGNIIFLQNAAHLPQNPIGPEVSYKLQKLTEKSKNYENYHSNKKTQYHQETQNQIHHNKGNVMQYINKDNPIVVTPIQPENSWSQANYLSSNNKYSNNEKLLQGKLIQPYNQYNPPTLNLVYEANKRDPANLYHNLNANALSGIKQYESGKLNTDSSSAQANYLDHYKQYLVPVKNLIYPQINPETGYLLTQQIPYPSQNTIPLSFEKNNALHNSYFKNYNQVAAQSNMPNRLVMYPNSYYYYKPNLGITNSAQNTQENYGIQFQDLNRLLSVSNLDKLNVGSSKNGIVELTYKLNNSEPSEEPFFYVKYRLPYNVFLLNLNKLLLEQPKLGNNLQLLYKDLLIGSNITSSNVLKSLDKEELLRLVSTNGTLVTAKVLDANTNEQIKIIQKLNANMPLKDIVRNDDNINKDSNRTANIPLINSLRSRPNFLNNLQRDIAMKKTNLYPHNTQANQLYNAPHPNYLSNRKPNLGYNYLQNKQNQPYPKYGFNSYSRYPGSRG